MGLTLITWLGAGGYRSRLNQLRDHWFSYAVVGLFLIICLGGLYSTGTSGEILYQIHKYSRLLFILPAITLLQDEKWRERSLWAFGAAMFLTLALSMISAVWPLSFVLGTANGPRSNHFAFKDHIAQNLMMSFFALFIAMKAQTKNDLRIKAILFSISILAIINILFFVAGRTGFLALALNFAAFIFFLPSKKQKAIGLVVIFFIAFLTFQFSNNFNNRVASAITEFKNQEKKELTSIGLRIEFFKKSIQLIKERPLTGFGTGSYAKEFCRVADSAEWCEAGKFHPHNQFIAFGVQLGVIGIAAYLALLGTAATAALKQSELPKVCAIGLVAAIIVDSITHAPLFLVTEAQFFILLFSALLAQKANKTGSIQHTL